MKIAYLITAYESPAHFHRLTRAIATGNSSVFVHLDAKADSAAFERGKIPAVTFVQPRIPVYWGEFSMVRAILLLMDHALRAPQSFDYLCLISGADYPIRPIQELETFLATHAGAEFMNLTPMPNDYLGKPISRLQRYKVPSGALFGVKRMRLRQALARLGAVPADRDYATALGGLRPYGGSTWCTLTRAACRYILDFVSNERRIIRFYRDSKFPDEGLLHTIIGNSRLVANVHRNLTYTDWRAGGRSPAPLSQEHIDRFLSEEMLVADDRFGPGEVFFARKFSESNSDLVDQLDAKRVHPSALVADSRIVSAQ